MTLTVITPPAAQAVSRDVMKASLRIGNDGEDELVDRLIVQATAWLESASDLALVKRRVRRTVTSWSRRLGGRGLSLKPGPAMAVISVETGLADSADREDITDRFSMVSGRLCLRPWTVLPAIPAGSVAEITYDAGFGTAAQVPEELKLAVKLLATELYESGAKEAPTSGLPTLVDAIISAYRQVRL